MLSRLPAVTGAAAFVLGLLAVDDGGYFPRSWGWAGTLLALVAAGLLVADRGGVRGTAEQVFVGALAGAAAWTGLSALWSQSAPSSLSELGRALVPAAGALAALALRRTDAQALARGALTAATLVSLVNLGHRLGGGGMGTGSESAPVGYANALGILAVLGILLGLSEARSAGLTVRAAALAAVLLNGAVLALSVSTGAVGALVLGLAAAAVVAGGRLRVAGIVAGIVLAVGAVALFSGHERGEYWSVALGASADHPFLGTGAGTFGQVWLEERDAPRAALAAHGLYVETLAEQGPVGLALLLAALAAPLAAARRSRRPLVAGAYVAFLGHAAIDWVWDLTGVALIALAVGASLLLEARRPDELPSRRGGGLALAGAIAVVALVGWVGAVALEWASSALRAGEGSRAAARAETAAALAPWASEPWLVASQARLLAGERGAAAAAARRGLQRDGHDWRLWVALATATDGAEKERALVRARSLNPLGGV